MTIQSGRMFGPYEILSLLGAGGMGEVYRARDTRLQRSVAIKVLPTQLHADEKVRVLSILAIDGQCEVRLSRLFEIPDLGHFAASRDGQSFVIATEEKGPGDEFFHVVLGTR